MRKDFILKMNRAQMLSEMKRDIDRLTQPFTHIEKTETGVNYVGHHLGLFDQFRLELTESTKNKNENGPKKPAGSKPPMADKHLELRIEITKIIRDLALLTVGQSARYPEESLRDILTACLRSDEHTIRLCYENISGLRRRLEELLTWEIPPKKLKGYCPICETKNKLLVYMDAYGPIYAICTYCNAKWDRDVLGILARSLEEKNIDKNVQ